MTKINWEVLLDNFWKRITIAGWMFLFGVPIAVSILVGYNLRIHDNEKYVTENAEFRMHQELLSSEFVKVIIDRDEYKTIIDNLQEHPLALEIIKCESEFNANAFNKDSDDWSYWQINDYWHREPARKRGYNIEDPKHNLQYGFELYLEKNGLKYWNPSRHCWAKLK